jgi:hypothetical protein
MYGDERIPALEIRPGGINDRAGGTLGDATGERKEKQDEHARD